MQKFNIAKEEIKREFMKKFKKTSMATIVICLLILILYVIVAAIYMENTKAVLIGTVSLIGFLLLPIVLIINLSFYKNGVVKMKKMPMEIVVAEDAIMIDGIAYTYESIRQIRVTPPSYAMASFGKNAAHREMTVVDKNNKKTSFFMGFRHPEKMIFKEYEALCTVLKKQFMNHPEKFIYEL